MARQDGGKAARSAAVAMITGLTGSGPAIAATGYACLSAHSPFDPEFSPAEALAAENRRQFTFYADSAEASAPPLLAARAR
jgi:hypothetical protein